MASLYFVRDGRGDQHTSQAHPVPLKQVQVLASKHQTKFFKSGPTVNSGVASPFAPYRHIVVEIEPSETSQDFPTAGFYYFIGLSPSDAQLHFGISNP